MVRQAHTIPDGMDGDQDGRVRLTIADTSTPYAKTHRLHSDNLARGLGEGTFGRMSG